MYKVLVAKQDDSIYTFNELNKFVQLKGTLLGQLTVDHFTKYGFNDEDLEKSYSDFFSKFIKVQDLDENGEKMEILSSEELNKSMNIKNLDIEYDSNDEPLLKVTVPQFTIKDNIRDNDKLLFFTTESTAKPEIYNFKINKSQVHDEMIKFEFSIKYNYNTKCKFKFKVNDVDYQPTYSASQLPYETFIGYIDPTKLKLGKNSITVTVATEDEKVTNEQEFKEVVELLNNEPTITIIPDSSNSYKLHFIISDTDKNDSLEYRIIINNTTNSNKVIQDWKKCGKSPSEIFYFIDTTDVVVDELNSITIEFKDSYGKINSGIYTFNGEYRNLLFKNEDGYFTTDKGVVLKLLKYKIVAGTVSEPTKIILKNGNGFDVSGLTIKPEYKVADKFNKIELCKQNNPFIPVDNLDYADEVIKAGEELEFYVRINSDVKSPEAKMDFIINANAKALK